MLDQLLPRLSDQLRTARQWFTGNASASERLNRVSKHLDDFLALRRPDPATAGARVVVPAGPTVPFDRMATAVRAVRDDEYAATEQSADEATSTPCR